MTLDDAIEHADLVADNCEGECSEDHKQLAMWLRELKKHRAVQDVTLANARAANLESEQLKSENASLRGAAMGLGELCDQLKGENKRLRELVRDMWLFTSLTSAIVGEIHSREHGTWNADVFRNRMHELGIEVEE